jgi:hypothetical protein
MTYKHTQVGWWFLIFFVPCAVFLLVIEIRQRTPLLLPPLFILLAALAMFNSLTVEIRDNILDCRFGIGLIRKQFLLPQIRDVRVVRNKWYCGWGIRWVPTGWLFNIAGLDAVEIDLATGKKFRIGTDDSQNLLGAIRRAHGPRPLDAGS